MSHSSRPSIKPWCVSRPKTEVGRVPPKDGISYRVQNGDNWHSLAARWNMDVWSLIYYNYRTYEPKEVNWYLQEYAGCVLPTADRKNWCFSSAAVPGIIYHPQKPAPLPVPVPMPAPRPPLDEDAWKPGTGAWLGIGVKGGGHVVLGGADSATVFAISMDNPWTWALLQISMGRLGPGLGASGGLVVVGIGNCYDWRTLRGYPVSGGDFQLAVGGKWGSLMKLAGKVGALVETVKAGRDATRLLSAGVFTAAKRHELINSVKNQTGALGIFPSPGETDLTVNVVDLPVGIGAEVSAYYGWGSVNVLTVHEADE